MNKTPVTNAIPEVVWAPLVSAVLTLLSGFIGLAAHQMWLFPSLAPTAYIHAVHPDHPSSRFYNTVVGHLLAMGFSFLTVLALGVTDAPSAVAGQVLVPGRIWASGIAMLVTLLFQIPLRAVHAPAAATALLVSLGAFKPTWAEARTITFAVLIAAAAGELFRRARLMPKSR